jgi:hypothetical protein
MIGRDFWGEREFKGAGQQLSTKKETKTTSAGEPAQMSARRKYNSPREKTCREQSISHNAAREIYKQLQRTWEGLQVCSWLGQAPTSWGGGGAKEVGASKYEALWGEYECQ